MRRYLIVALLAVIGFGHNASAQHRRQEQQDKPDYWSISIIHYEYGAAQPVIKTLPDQYLTYSAAREDQHRIMREGIVITDGTDEINAYGIAPGALLSVNVNKVIVN